MFRPVRKVALGFTLLELEVMLESLDHVTSPLVRNVAVRRACPEAFQ